MTVLLLPHDQIDSASPSARIQCSTSILCLNLFLTSENLVMNKVLTSFQVIASWIVLPNHSDAGPLSNEEIKAFFLNR